MRHILFFCLNHLLPTYFHFKHLSQKRNGKQKKTDQKMYVILVKRIQRNRYARNLAIYHRFLKKLIHTGAVSGLQGHKSR